MKELVDYIKNHTERTQSLDANTVKQGENVTVITVDSVKTQDIPDKPSSDVHFFKVATQNDPQKEELKKLIDKYYPTIDRLVEGPSYIEIGAEIGSQEIGLLFMGLGELLGLWKVITPAKMGLPSDLAGQGFVMCSGYKR